MKQNQQPKNYYFLNAKEFNTLFVISKINRINLFFHRTKMCVIQFSIEIFN